MRLFYNKLLFVFVAMLFSSAIWAKSNQQLAQFQFDQQQYRQALTWLSDEPDSQLKAHTLLKLGLFEEAKIILAELPNSQSNISNSQHVDNSMFWFTRHSARYCSVLFI